MFHNNPNPARSFRVTGVYLLPGNTTHKTTVCLTSPFQNIMQSGLEMVDFQILGEEEGRKVKIVTKNISIIHTLSQILST